jgi:hypothetical protein
MVTVTIKDLSPCCKAAIYEIRKYTQPDISPTDIQYKCSECEKELRPTWVKK